MMQTAINLRSTYRVRLFFFRLAYTQYTHITKRLLSIYILFKIIQSQVYQNIKDYIKIRSIVLSYYRRLLLYKV